MSVPPMHNVTADPGSTSASLHHLVKKLRRLGLNSPSTTLLNATTLLSATNTAHATSASMPPLLKQRLTERSVLVATGRNSSLGFLIGSIFLVLEWNKQRRKRKRNRHRHRREQSQQLMVLKSSTKGRILVPVQAAVSEEEEAAADDQESGEVEDDEEAAAAEPEHGLFWMEKGWQWYLLRYPLFCSVFTAVWKLGVQVGRWLVGLKGVAPDGSRNKRRRLFIAMWAFVCGYAAQRVAPIFNWTWALYLLLRSGLGGVRMLLPLQYRPAPHIVYGIGLFRKLNFFL